MPARNLSNLVKKTVASSQKWQCKGCNDLLNECYEIDHIKCLKDRGSNNISNLQALCPTCHRRKTNVDLATKKTHAKDTKKQPIKDTKKQPIKDTKKNEIKDAKKPPIKDTKKNEIKDTKKTTDKRHKK